MLSRYLGSDRASHKQAHPFTDLQLSVRLELFVSVSRRSRVTPITNLTNQQSIGFATDAYEHIEQSSHSGFKFR